jgi:hypothetical protein
LLAAGESRSAAAARRLADELQDALGRLSLMLEPAVPDSKGPGATPSP